MTRFELFKMTLFVRIYAFFKIPLLGWIRPSLVEMNETRTVLKIPLGRRTQNHLGVMYFGALAMGAEASVAFRAVSDIQKCGQRVDFLFKDFQAQFLKRAEGDVHFICEQGVQVGSLVQKTLVSRVRETQTFEAFAIVPSIDPNAKIATFQITLSVKVQERK